MEDWLKEKIEEEEILNKNMSEINQFRRQVRPRSTPESAWNWEWTLKAVTPVWRVFNRLWNRSQLRDFPTKAVFLAVLGCLTGPWKQYLSKPGMTYLFWVKKQIVCLILTFSVFKNATIFAIGIGDCIIKTAESASPGREKIWMEGETTFCRPLLEEVITAMNAEMKK